MFMLGLYKGCCSCHMFFVGNLYFVVWFVVVYA